MFLGLIGEYVGTIFTYVQATAARHREGAGELRRRGRNPEMSGTLARLQAHRLWQPLSYLAVGGWNTVFGLGLFWLA